MRKELRFIFILLLLSILSTNVHAAKRYWVATLPSTWNTTANWSATSGGAGGSSVPGSSDTAYFDGNGLGIDTINATVNIKRLDISSAYLGTIIQGSNSITIGTSGATLSGGTFVGGSASITVSGAFTISGTAFTSTSGTFSTSASFTISSGSFTHNSGTLTLTATSTLTVSNTGGTTFYNLSFPPTAASATYTITSTTTLTVSHLFSIAGTQAAIFNSGTINVTGDITNTSTAAALGGGTATIAINGTTKQTFTGTTLGDRGRLPNIIINKSSDTLVLVNKIITVGNWTYTAGIINAGTSEIWFGNTTVTGSHSLYNVIFYGGVTFTIASGTTLTVKGTLTLGTGGLNVAAINTGTINAEGNISMAASTSGTGIGGTATIVINGTANQSLLGSTTVLAARICNVTINKTSGTLTITNNITVLKNWTYTAGTVDAGTSKLYFMTSKTISGTHALYDAQFDGSGAYTYTIASGTTLTVNGTLIINGTNAVTLNTGTINATGNITTINTATTAAGTASLVVNGTGTQTLTGNGTAGQGRLPKITIDKSSGTLNLSSVITVYGDWIYKQGSVDPKTSTVVLYGTANLDGQAEGSSNMMSFYTLALAANTRTLTGNIDVNNNLSIGNGATLSAGANSIYCAGTWSNTSGTWTYGTSTVIFDGNTYKQISKTGGAAETFYNLSFNRASASQTLACPVTVNNNLTLTKGHVKTTSTNYLLLIDNATLTGGSDSAYVHGPMRKTGNDAFTFPLGDTTLVDTAYHPLAITAPAVATDQFEGVYYAYNQTYGDSLVDSLASISTCEYWTLERKVGSSTPTVSVSWNKNSCNVSGYDNLRLAQWNGTKWLDMGVSSVTVSDYRGTVTGYSTPGYSVNPVPILMGSPVNSFQYAVLAKKLDGGYYQAINGKLFFRYDEEYNDADGYLTFKIYEDNAEKLSTPISSSSSLPTPLKPLVKYGDNRYRLNTIQCDFTITGGALPNGFYILEVINEKNEHWYLRFKNYSTISVICSPLPG